MTFHFWINYTVKCSKALKTLLHTLSEKKGYTTLPLEVQQLVTGASTLKGQLCTLSTTKRCILVPYSNMYP